MSNIVEQKRAKYNNIFKVGLIAIVAFIVAPIIFTVITGMVGLIAAAVIGLVAVNATPWLSMKLANWKIKSIVAEAKENPIETLTNLLIEKRKAFGEFKTRVTDAVTARNTFTEKCNKFAVKYPNRAPEFKKQLESMTGNVDKMKVALDAAQDSITDGEHKLEEMKAYWEMSEAAIAANRAAGMDIGDVYSKLKADTACDAVFENMNRAFAEMEVASSLQIENDPSPTFMGTTLDVQTKVQVR
jgi:phage shock protein A